MKFVTVALFGLLNIISTFASGAGTEVLWQKGEVTYQGQRIVKGMSIELGSTLTTGKKSYVKLQVPSVGKVKGFSVVLGPESSLVLTDSPSESYTFIQGAARFLHEKVNGEEQSAVIKTKQVSFGVRGTEYLVKVNPVLGESEIVLFEGKVEMGNLNDPENFIEVNPGQWGGLGGRFGSKINPPISLPTQVLAGFQKLLKI